MGVLGTRTSRRRFRWWVPVLSLVWLVVASPATAADGSEFVGPSIPPGDPSVFFLPGALAGRSPSAGWDVTTRAPGVDVGLGGWMQPVVASNPRNRKYMSIGYPSVTFDADGRLFWSLLVARMGNYFSWIGKDIMVAQCDPTTGNALPGYPVNITAQSGLPGTSADTNDLNWLAADAGSGSPYRNRLYLSWTHFPSSGLEVSVVSYSTDHGLTWSPAQVLGSAGSGYIWPTHIAVAPNGDVYVADHRQPGFVGGVPNGVSGYVALFRSTDGGVTFPQESQPFPAGTADMTFNVQSLAGAIPGVRFWLQGSVQPWVLPDPLVPGRVHVVVNDDPDDVIGLADPADVYIVTSNDFGLTWSSPLRLSDGPGTSLQVMPTATIDPWTGYIAVHWYDDRRGLVNGAGHALLDVYATLSVDGGATFAPSFRVDDDPFDPSAGTQCRYNCGEWIVDIWSAGGGEAFAVTGSGVLLHRVGGTWSQLASIGVGLYAVWGTSATDVFVSGSGGAIYHYDGVQLVLQPSGTTDVLWAMDGTSGSDVTIVGTRGTVLHYDGAVWTPRTTGITEHLNDVWVSPAGTVFAVGENSRALRFDGAWTDISPAGVGKLLGVWGTSDTDVHVTRLCGDPLRWNGTSWAFEDIGQSVVTGMWGSSASDIVAIGWGRVGHFDGVQWADQAVTENLLIRVHGTASDDIYAAGEQGSIVHFDGTSWAVESNPGTPTNPTLLIGAHNSITSMAGRTFLVWTGNTTQGGSPLDLQVMFDQFDAGAMVTGTIVDLDPGSSDLRLDAPSPNPARRAVTFSYRLPRPANVEVAVLDLLGRRMATLAQGMRPAGRHELRWDVGADGRFAPGVYELRVDDGTQRVSRKLVLMPAGAGN